MFDGLDSKYLLYGGIALIIALALWFLFFKGGKKDKYANYGAGEYPAEFYGEVAEDDDSDAENYDDQESEEDFEEEEAEPFEDEEDDD